MVLSASSQEAVIISESNQVKMMLMMYISAGKKKEWWKKWHKQQRFDSVDNLETTNVKKIKLLMDILLKCSIVRRHLKAVKFCFKPFKHQIRLVLWRMYFNIISFKPLPTLNNFTLHLYVITQSTFGSRTIDSKETDYASEKDLNRCLSFFHFETWLTLEMRFGSFHNF